MDVLQEKVLTDLLSVLTKMAQINGRTLVTELCVNQNLEDIVVVMKHLITTLGLTFMLEVVLVAVKIVFKICSV